MKPLKSQNYYEILGVARSATPDEIRGAYELSKVTFQDNSLATYSLFTDEENQEILALISRAYETLFNPELRHEYDGFLDGLEREGGRSRVSPQPKPQALRAGAAGRPRQQRPAPTPPGRPPREPTAERTQGSGERSPGAAERTPPGRAQMAAEPPPAPQGAPEEAAAVEPPVGGAGAPDATDKFIESVACFNGPALKKVRELRGMSLEEIAERTKIRKTYIQYLEDEQFTFLPAPVYVKGFVTMIAGMLDLPAQRVAEEYMSYYRGNQLL